MELALLIGFVTLKHNASCKAVPPYPKLDTVGEPINRLNSDEETSSLSLST